MVRTRITFSKRFLIFIVCVFMCFISLLPFAVSFANGVTVPRVESGVYVYDDENDLSSQQKETLNALLRSLEEKTSIEFAVITTSSYAGMSMDDYAHDLFNTLRIGKSGKDNGILFLFSSTEGHARLEIGYGLEDVLTDGICGRILDAYYVPNRSRSKTVESIIETVNGVLAVLGNKYNVDLVSNQGELVKSINEERTVPWWVVVLIIILIMAIIGAVVESDSDDSSSSSSDGGFFSSSSSGGSFGGGFSGGGGAGR